jgi:hypothetical protein
VVPLGGHRQLGNAQAHSTPIRAGGAEHRPSPTPSHSLLQHPGAPVHTQVVWWVHTHMWFAQNQCLTTYFLSSMTPPPKKTYKYMWYVHTRCTTRTAAPPPLLTPPYLLIFLNE